MNCTVSSLNSFKCCIQSSVKVQTGQSTSSIISNLSEIAANQNLFIFRLLPQSLNCKSINWCVGPTILYIQCAIYYSLIINPDQMHPGLIVVIGKFTS